MKHFALIAFFMTGLALQAVPLQFNYSVNTSLLSGQAGQLDFQFNPASPGGDAATATLSGFSGATLGSGSLSGGASGGLGTSLVISNSQLVNGLLQNVTFGSSFQFVLNIIGPLVDSPQGFDGSTFALQNGSTMLVQIDVLPGFEPFVFTDGSVNQIPEPSSALVVLFALGALGLSRR